MAAATARGTSDACIVAWPPPVRAAVLSKRCDLGQRTNHRIGAALNIADKTVARHLSNIFAKTGVTSRTAAAYRVPARARWVNPPIVGAAVCVVEPMPCSRRRSYRPGMTVAGDLAGRTAAPR
jgi:hypothetical protein